MWAGSDLSCFADCVGVSLWRCCGAGLRSGRKEELLSKTMANWHARDVCGCLLLLLVFTEAARKWSFVQNLSNANSNQMVVTHDPAIHQVSRRLLVPDVKSGYRIPALCRVKEICDEGVGVTCVHGNVVGCSCEFIGACYPQVYRCSRFNSTQTEPCGF